VTGQPITLSAEGLVAILASLPDHALAPLASRFAELTARPEQPGRWLTVAEAAELLRAPVSFIYNARSDGRLTPHKRGSRAVVDRAEALIRPAGESSRRHSLACEE